MRTEITQEHVNVAAETIKAAGQKVTARAVLQKIGSGSLTTLLPFVQNWKNGQVKEAQNLVELPAGLTKVIVDFIDYQRIDAQKDLHAEIGELRHNEEELVKESTRQLDEINVFNGTVESLQIDNAVLSKDNVRVENELIQANHSLTSERAAHAAMRTKYEVLKSQLQDAKDDNESLGNKLNASEANTDKALQESAKLRIKLDDERVAREVERTQVAVLKSKLEDFGASVSALKADLIQANAAANKAVAETAELRGQLTNVNEALANERVAHETARTAIAVSNSKLEDAMAVIEGLKADLDTMHVSANKTAKEAAELRGQLSALKNESEPKQ